MSGPSRSTAPLKSQQSFPSAPSMPSHTPPTETDGPAPFPPTQISSSPIPRPRTISTSPLSTQRGVRTCFLRSGACVLPSTSWDMCMPPTALSLSSGTRHSAPGNVFLPRGGRGLSFLLVGRCWGSYGICSIWPDGLMQSRLFSTVCWVLSGRGFGGGRVVVDGWLMRLVPIGILGSCGIRRRWLFCSLSCSSQIVWSHHGRTLLRYKTGSSFDFTSSNSGYNSYSDLLANHGDTQIKSMFVYTKRHGPLQMKHGDTR